MKRFPLIVGQFGLGLIGLGLVGAILGAFLPPAGPVPLSVPLIVGAFLYLVGGLLAVGAFDYRRGTKLFLAMRFARILFAVAVVYGFLRAMQMQ